MAIDKSIFDLINQDKPADLKDIITKELKDRIEREIENYKKNDFPKEIMGLKDNAKENETSTQQSGEEKEDIQKQGADQ